MENNVINHRVTSTIRGCRIIYRIKKGRGGDYAECRRDRAIGKFVVYRRPDDEVEDGGKEYRDRTSVLGILPISVGRCLSIGGTGIAP